MKIYTKTGDKGETSLFTGRRVLKANEWVNLYGCLDELNCFIGVLSAKLSEGGKCFSHCAEELTLVQRNLFSLGSFYASEATKPEYVEGLADWVLRLENSMDQRTKILPPLKNFILPGGSFEASLSHMARVKARSVEREAVKTGMESVLDTVVYLNRLSDYFFVLARFINLKLDKKEAIWLSEV